MGPRQRAQGRKRRNGGNQNHSPSPWSQNDLSSPSPWSQSKTNSRVPNAQSRGLVHDWQEFSDSNAFYPQKTMLSMTQAARNTERHAMAWGSSKLREQRITFVSAGNLKQEDIEAIAKENEDKKEEESLPEEPTSLPKLVHQPQAPVSETEHLFVSNNSPEPVAQSPLPRKESVSSESSEKILFAGRRNPPMESATNSTPATSKPTPSSTPKPVETKPPSECPLATPEITTRESNSSGLERFNNILPSHWRKTADSRGRTQLQQQNLWKRNDDEVIMNDYIANMTFNDDSDDRIPDTKHSVKTGRRTEHFRFFDGASESKVKLQSMPSSHTTTASAKVNQAIDWESADLQDFDAFSTTDEEVVEISQVLRHRTRPSGPQYLVSALGEAASDPRWVLHVKLKSASAVKEIGIFEEIKAMRLQETTGDSDDSDSDEVLDDLMDDVESEDEENDRILKHTAKMTDEQIARALAKQEELGMGSDELLLLDGNVDDGDDDEKIDDDDDDDDEFAAADGFIPFSAKQHLSSRTTSKRNRRQRDHFPSASAFADALDQDPYGAFDIMDFERPSLRPKKKGRKSNLPFELGVEDPELADRLRSTWEKDREKKANRKVEKQMEREAALIEASERSEPAAIKAEIKQFLIEEATTLELAPMDSAKRASMHRLAKSLKLNSKSQGKDGHGDGRYPIFTKGAHTPKYTIDTIWEIDALLESRKFFPKHAFSVYKVRRTTTPGSARARRGGGGAMSGATYMNGDVVGASAPEIGAGNKGRAMLERMGWQSGMGIGAVGNKGSIEVIKHVVKTTKAGLG